VWRSRQRGAGRCGYLKSFVSREPLRPRARGLPEADPQPARGEKPAAAAGRGAAANRTRLWFVARVPLRPRGRGRSPTCSRGPTRKQAAAAGQGAAATRTRFWRRCRGGQEVGAHTQPMRGEKFEKPAANEAKPK